MPPLAAEGADGLADPRVLVAHARGGLVPLGVGLRQGGQDEPLLDLEVAPPARLPERPQVRDGVIEVPGAGAAQPEGRVEGMVVVARQRREGRGPLHPSRPRVRAPVGARDDHPQALRRDSGPGSWPGERGGRAAASARRARRRQQGPISSASSGAPWWRAASTTTMQQREGDHEQRDGAVEAACLGMRPRVQGPDDLAAVVGVGAAPCAGTRCRRGPWRGSAPAGARGRTRAATGARPRGHSQWS